MLKYINAKIPVKKSLRAGALPPGPASLAACLGLLLCIAATGCGTAALPPIIPVVAQDTNAPSLSLHEGDVVQVKFAAAPEMDSVQSIRADGKITILNAGEVRISGLTPEGAQQTILAAADPYIKIKQVTVTVQSSAFIIYLTGAVGHAGKLISDRPLTLLQAVLDAGVDSTRSNLKSVKVMRTDANGHNTFKIIDLNNAIKGVNGGQAEPFTLKPYDLIIVPEKFTWF